MDSKREITIYLEGLSEEDREKLLSVLVLAEIRLRSSWVLEPRREHADVRLYRQCSLQESMQFRPVICYTDMDGSGEADRTEEGIFFLSVDSGGVPTFSELINVFNRVDAWLNTGAEKASLYTQAKLDGEVSNIPTLTPEEDSPLECACLESEPSADDLLQAPAEDTGHKFLPWLRGVAEYVHNVNLKEENYYHKILLQSGEVFLIDFENKRFYSDVELEFFLDSDSSDKNTYISSLDRRGFLSELDKKEYAERPLSHFQWFMALYSDYRSCSFDVEKQIYSLSGWPSVNLPGLRQEHLKLAAFMRSRKASLAEIAMETGMPVDQIQSFMEACHYEGLVLKETIPEDDNKDIPEKPTGFWNRILRRVKK